MDISSQLPHTRRHFLQSTLAAAAMTAMPAPWLRALTNDAPVVKTALGSIRGEAAKDVHIFRGIPFAEPPTGTLRFRPPVPVKSWSGVRDAIKFPPAAVQFGDPSIPQSEDCLYLNMWAPASQGPHPVFVWIHGGGFTGGNSFAPVFDGTVFAQQGIVCITVAYRLGIFGFLDMEPLLGASYAGSGNNALRDLICALQWVKEHVADFGGDPTRVTIGGESAGAKLADILMGIPSADALFHQVISESGGAERVWPHETALRIARGFGEEWKSDTGNALSTLLTAEAASIIQVQHRFETTWPQHFPLRPELDGKLLQALPVHTIAAGSTKGKRLLIGTNRDESALFLGTHPMTVTAGDLGNLPLQQFQPIEKRYALIYPDAPSDLNRLHAVTAEEYWVPTMRLIDAHVRGGGTAWLYRMDFAPSEGTYKGYAFHASELDTVWNHPHTKASNAAQHAALALQVNHAWASFIQGDAPHATGLPIWPQYQTETRPTMLFNNTSTIANNPQEAELALWKNVL